MSSNEIFLQVKSILTTYCKVTNPVHLESNLKNDLEVDSVGAIHLITEIDKAFQIDLEEASDMQIPSTVQDLVRMIEKALLKLNS